MTYDSQYARRNDPVTPGPNSPAPSPPPEPVPPPGKRPATVTGAAVLMTFMTLVVVGSAALLMYVILSTETETTSPQDAEAYWWFRTITVCIGTFYMLVGLGVLGLVAAVLRGRNWARIFTFCLFAIFILCAGVGEVGALMFTEGLASMDGGGMTADDLKFSAGFTAVFATQMLTMAVTILLLALPPTNRWFKAYARARSHGVV